MSGPALCAYARWVLCSALLMASAARGWEQKLCAIKTLLKRLVGIVFLSCNVMGLSLQFSQHTLMARFFFLLSQSSQHRVATAAFRISAEDMTALAATRWPCWRAGTSLAYTYSRWGVGNQPTFLFWCPYCWGGGNGENGCTLSSHFWWWSLIVFALRNTTDMI